MSGQPGQSGPSQSNPNQPPASAISQSRNSYKTGAPQRRLMSAADYWQLLYLYEIKLKQRWEIDNANALSSQNPTTLPPTPQDVQHLEVVRRERCALIIECMRDGGFGELTFESDAAASIKAKDKKGLLIDMVQTMRRNTLMLEDYLLGVLKRSSSDDEALWLKD